MLCHSITLLIDFQSYQTIKMVFVITLLDSSIFPIDQEQPRFFAIQRIPCMRPLAIFNILHHPGSFSRHPWLFEKNQKNGKMPPAVVRQYEQSPGVSSRVT